MKTDDLQQVLLGSILGDGYLCLNRRSTNAHYEEIHSEAQLPYLTWKASIMESLTPIKITNRHIFDNRTKKTYSQVRLRTRVHPLLTDMFHAFYYQGHKAVNSHHLNEIDPLGLATWYMDDGSYCYLGRWSKIATCDFDFDDNKLLRDYLKARFDLTAKIYFQKWYELRFDVPNTRKLFSIIKPYVHFSLRYKLGEDVVREMIARNKAKEWERHRYPRTGEEIDLMLEHIKEATP